MNIYTADLGGPIVKDKTHFFGGYEHTERDLSGLSVITITPANQAALGLNEPPYSRAASTPSSPSARSITRSTAGNRLSFRYMFFDNFITANVGGGILSVQRANDFSDRQHSTGAQLVSTLGRGAAQRTARAVRDARAGARTRTRCRGRVRRSTSPAWRNSAGRSPRTADAGFGFTQDVLQINDSATLLKGDHAFKAGLDVQHVADTRTLGARSQLYTFPNRGGVSGGA